MDFKGPMDDGYYAFVLLCTWTKWPEVYWVKSTSFNSIKKHLDSFWAQWGRASIIISDLGPPFFGHEFKNYLKTLGIKHRPTLPENPQNNEVENVNRRIRKAVDLAKVTKEDYKTCVRRMLMVVRATPTHATKVSPHFAATGRELDPGILDTRFPLVQKSGLTKEQHQEIQKNLKESKEKTREIQNRQKYRVHLKLKTGDNVLVRLGNKKIPEPDTYVVVRVEGNAITARNETSGRVLTRHLSRFTKLTEQSNPKESKNCDPPVKEQEPSDPHPKTILDGALPLEVPNPVPLDREQEDRRAQEEDQERRQVQFNPQAQVLSPVTIRQKSWQSGVPPPEFPNGQSSTFERSSRARATAQQLLDQYRGDKAAARRNQYQPR